MLEGKFEYATVLKKIVEAIKDCVQFCNFNCEEQGIKVQAIDDSRVLLVSLLIGADAFTQYRCDRNITLGIDMKSFSKILRCGSNEDKLTLVAQDKPDSVSLLFEDEVKNRSAEYSLKLMDIDSEFLKIDEMEFDAVISMNAAEFQKICRDLGALSESLKITVTKDSINFSATGDSGSGNVTVKAKMDLDNPQYAVSIDLNQPVELTFGLSFIADIVKATSLSTDMTLKLSDKSPALFEYKINSGYLRYYLAPKFDDDE